MLTTPCSEYFSVRRYNKMFVLTGNLVNVLSGVHHWEPATNPYSCHDDFTDRSIFSLNLCQIQIPTGTSVTNCNHQHGPMLTCRHVHMRPHCFILTEACSCRLHWPIFREKYLKIDWSVKMPLRWLITGVAGSQYLAPGVVQH